MRKINIHMGTYQFDKRVGEERLVPRPRPQAALVPISPLHLTSLNGMSRGEQRCAVLAPVPILVGASCPLEASSGSRSLQCPKGTGLGCCWGRWQGSEGEAGQGLVGKADPPCGVPAGAGENWLCGWHRET